jgi:transposase-like protein
LEMYGRLQSADAMPSAVLRRTVSGVSTREYEHLIDIARDGFGVAKSSVSRDFVRASAAQVKALAERGFSGQRQNAVIQRCQVHKKRNVKAHVPEKHLPELDQRLGAA